MNVRMKSAVFNPLDLISILSLLQSLNMVHDSYGTHDRVSVFLTVYFMKDSPGPLWRLVGSVRGTTIRQWKKLDQILSDREPSAS